MDDRLDFFREPDNPHDAKAIVIKNMDGIKVGYVPREDNVIFSRLMDAGKLLFGRITYKEMKGKWLKIDIKIYLHE
ncbi:MAG: HIRAN domain-containing protein [Draconibacterium sp.]